MIILIFRCLRAYTLYFLVSFNYEFISRNPILPREFMPGRSDERDN